MTRAHHFCVLFQYRAPFDRSATQGLPTVFSQHSDPRTTQTARDELRSRPRPAHRDDPETRPMKVRSARNRTSRPRAPSLADRRDRSCPVGTSRRRARRAATCRASRARSATELRDRSAPARPAPCRRPVDLGDHRVSLESVKERNGLRRRKAQGRRRSHPQARRCARLRQCRLGRCRMHPRPGAPNPEDRCR